ncbi:MAG: Crp/Fnr family transcriptional regulator [Chloroflexota bacterium]|nr:Crp/Fnr family transcriptional regulator [Chloroflexota bacterium]
MGAGDRPEPDHLLGDVPLFAELPPATLERLARESRLRRFPRGQVLCSEGDPGDSLLVLEEGRVRISRYSAGGQEVVLAAVEAPAAFGELALIDGALRSATITAQTPVRVRVLGREAVQSLIARESSVAMGLLRAVTAMVRTTNERLSDILSLDVPGRVAKWLLARAETHGARRPEGIAVPLGLSQGELAAEIGTTRVSVNKALKGFEARGVIALDLERDEVVLRQPEELRASTL